MAKLSRKAKTKQRHLKVRKKISGTAETPRLSIYKSNSHFYAQIINDENGTTLCSASTTKMELDSTSNSDAAIAVAKEIAKKAIDLKITTVVFDRGGNLYHGNIKAFADAAREAGLVF